MLVGFIIISVEGNVHLFFQSELFNWSDCNFINEEDKYCNTLMKKCLNGVILNCSATGTLFKVTQFGNT